MVPAPPDDEHERPSEGRSAIVIGAGIGGLAAAMALSRQGYSVVVIERDDTPMPDDVEGAFAWDRRGAPQVRHTHGFPALIRVILRDRYPDVLEELLEAGVGELSIMPDSIPPGSPGYEQDLADLKVLCCRRTTLEWVFRRCAMAEPDVTIQVGVGVTGLVAERYDGVPLDVRGVRLEDGTELHADVVVASTGRRGDVPGWFAEHGVEIPEEEHPTGTVYLSRFYRSRDGAAIPMGYLGGRRAGLGFVVAGADNGTYSATFAVDADDGELRTHLFDPERFEATLPLFREMAPVVQSGGTPITPVQIMGGLINRIRRFVDPDGTPKSHGFFAIGDAHTCTNPLYGRGSSLAVLQAVLVADALAEHPIDRDEATRAYETASAAKVEPWFDVSVLTDLAARTTPPDAADAPDPGSLGPGPSVAEEDGEPEAPAPPRLDLATLRRIAASGDPVLSVLVIKTMSLLLTPQEVFGDPEVVSRLAAAAAVEAPRDPSKPRSKRLTRADILAVRPGPRSHDAPEPAHGEADTATDEARIEGREEAQAGDQAGDLGGDLDDGRSGEADQADPTAADLVAADAAVDVAAVDVAAVDVASAGAAEAGDPETDEPEPDELEASELGITEAVDVEAADVEAADVEDPAVASADLEPAESTGGSDPEAAPAPAPAPAPFPSALVAGLLVVALLAVVIGVTLLRDGDADDAATSSPPASTQQSVAPVPITETDLSGQVDSVGGAAPVGAAVNEVRLHVAESGVTGELHLQVDRAPDLDDPSAVGCFSVDIDLGARPLPIARDALGGPVAAGPSEVMVGYVGSPCAAGEPRDSEGRAATVVVTLSGDYAVGTVSFESADSAMTFSAASTPG